MFNKIPESSQLIKLDQSCKINISDFSIDEFKTFNPEGFNILCRLGEGCDSLQYFPNTFKIVLNSYNFSQLYFSFQREFLLNLADDFGVSKSVALKKAANFLTTQEPSVQPVGFQGKIYNAMLHSQDYLSMVALSKAVVALKTSGFTGLEIITKFSSL